MCLCVLEQSTVDNSSAETIRRDVQLGSISLRSALGVYGYTITLKSISDHLYNFLNWTARTVHVRKQKQKYKHSSSIQQPKGKGEQSIDIQNTTHTFVFITCISNHYTLNIIIKHTIVSQDLMSWVLLVTSCTL